VRHCRTGLLPRVVTRRCRAHAVPSRAPVAGFPGAVSGPCGARPGSPWPAPFSPPPPPVLAHQNRCSRASPILWGCPTPCTRASRSCPVGSPCGPGDHSSGQMQGLPGSAHSVSMHAEVSDPAGSVYASPGRRIRCCLPRVRSASAPRTGRFRGSILCLPVPLSTLRRRRYRRLRMTRGQRGWLDLHCLGLAPFTTVPAYPGACPNAGPKPRARAGARHERRLLRVGSRPMLGQVLSNGLVPPPPATLGSGGEKTPG
jgi:hypothetical protein